MDDLTFSARRAGAVATPPPVRPMDVPDIESRFRTLVQSPLRAGILRYLSSRPGEGFDVEALMHTFGRLRLDVEKCVRELVDFGVVQVERGSAPTRYQAERTTSELAAGLLGKYITLRATDTTAGPSR